MQMSEVLFIVLAIAGFALAFAVQWLRGRDQAESWAKERAMAFIALIIAEAKEAASEVLHGVTEDEIIAVADYCYTRLPERVRVIVSQTWFRQRFLEAWSELLELLDQEGPAVKRAMTRATA